MSDETLFPTLSEEQLNCLRPFSREFDAAVGETLFKEGSPADKFFVILDGELKVTRTVNGGEIVLAVHHPGQFTGEISLLSGGNCIATGRTVKPTRLLEMTAPDLRKVLVACPWMSEIIITAMASRRPEADMLAQQREKLAALGMMAAGLAHELNNPASAAQRAAEQLRENYEKQHALALALCETPLSPEQRGALSKFQREAFARAAKAEPLDTLTASDREDELADWLEAHGVRDVWDLAPAFVSAGLQPPQFEGLVKTLPESTLCEALHWIASTLSVAGLVDAVEQSMARVMDLVQAVKSYSYMDQAPVQELNVTDGMDNTLKILNFRLRKGSVKVHKEYDPDLPRITAYGSELSQVWTNLIVNALDAMNDAGNLILRTECENDAILVEVIDDGPGIPDDVMPHLFEPFFTTKGIGKGTGMGLNISYQIVVTRHHGDIHAISKPGETRFQVRLPVHQPANANPEITK